MVALCLPLQKRSESVVIPLTGLPADIGSWGSHHYNAAKRAIVGYLRVGYNSITIGRSGTAHSVYTRDGVRVGRLQVKYGVPVAVMSSLQHIKDVPDPMGEESELANPPPKRLTTNIGETASGEEVVYFSSEARLRKQIRCTQATLEALGIYGKCPWSGTGVVSAIQDAGYRWRLLSDWSGRRLSEFIKAHPRGRYYISTAGHAMALVDGVLTDTAERTGRRRIENVLEILGNRNTPQIEEAKMQKSQLSERELVALSNSEPNPALRKQYAARLARIRKYDMSEEDDMGMGGYQERADAAEVAKRESALLTQLAKKILRVAINIATDPTDMDSPGVGDIIKEARRSLDRLEKAAQSGDMM